MFINLIEISRILDNENNNIYNYFYLSIIKIPSIINETIPFIIIIAIAFLFRNLINNNELISIRNVGKSIFDVFLPIGTAILTIGLFILVFINPLSTFLESKYDKLINKLRLGSRAGKISPIAFVNITSKVLVTSDLILLEFTVVSGFL